MLTSVLWLLIGLVLLLLAGDRLVTSAGRIALRFGLSAMVIGATVVAFGTSMPEFTVSLISAINGVSGVAAGNVIGSNIANILLVLGLAAVISPVAAHRRMLRFDIPVLLVATAWGLLIFLDGEVSRIEGVISVIALILFSVGQLIWFNTPDVQAEGEVDFEGIPVPEGDSPARMRIEVPRLIASIGGLAAGSWLFVEGATTIAEEFGVSEFAIGATVVAVGTSLPEVATSVIASIRKSDDIAIGNVVGSNLFNILGVLGGAAAAAPVAIDTSLYQFEMPLLAFSAVVLLPLVWRRSHIGRLEGAALLLAFVGFVVATLVRGGS